MEESASRVTRSRSRSKTPFLRSSTVQEVEVDHQHEAATTGRRTPVRRTTPIKRRRESAEVWERAQPIAEEEEQTPPARRTRASTSKESAHPLQNNHLNHILVKPSTVREYHERVSTTTSTTASGQRVLGLADLSLSPIAQESLHAHTHAHAHAHQQRAHRTNTSAVSRAGSCSAHSTCSTDSSFAEVALANCSDELARNPSLDHLPSRLYIGAGDYCNKYPKTDYTYSRMSRDRVELAPGQVAVPNMSRRSLEQFRLAGPLHPPDHDEPDYIYTASVKNTHYSRYESSDDEGYPASKQYRALSRSRGRSERWWMTRMLLMLYSSLTSTLTTATSSLASTLAAGASSLASPFTSSRPHAAHLRARRYSNTQGAGVLRGGAALAAAPFYWIYSIIKTIVTSTVTTITETMSWGEAPERRGARRPQPQPQGKRSRSRWPWLLLLLLPLLAYGCYNSREILSSKQEEVPVFVRPEGLDPDVARRLASLEAWAAGVDGQLGGVRDGMRQLQAAVEAHVEHYSVEHLHANLARILNVGGKDGAVSAEELRAALQGAGTVGEAELQRIQRRVHERLMAEWAPGVDDHQMRTALQDALAAREADHMQAIAHNVETLVTQKMEELRAERGAAPCCGGTCECDIDEAAVRRIVADLLQVYDADKTGLVDYAQESAGGQVVSTRCTELYAIKTKQYSVLGVPVWWAYTSPRYALTPGAQPAECYAFVGFPGYLVVKTYAVIEVTGFSVEHMSRLLASRGRIESAPKNFSVYGLRDELDPEPHLLGQYAYLHDGAAIQHFAVQFPRTQQIGAAHYPVGFDHIELRIHSNHGNPTYTCLYRFRVHGNPLDDVSQAADDSFQENSNT